MLVVAMSNISLSGVRASKQNASPPRVLVLRVFPQMQPRHAFFWKYVSCWPESRSLIECADMKMHFRRAFAFARQGGPAPRAEPAQPAGRRVELRYLPFGHCIGVAPECHEHRDRRTAMLATALAMTPCYPYRVSRGDKSHRAAQAPALELSAHLVTLPFHEARLVGRSGYAAFRRAANRAPSPGETSRSVPRERC